MNKPRIGFIGQGFVGKNYADNFEARGYEVVRYSLEPEYKDNKDKIAECDIVFIAVPTPTTLDGFDDSIIKDTLTLVGNGKIVLIKSTILPGTTEKFQKEFPNILILNSPEFLNLVTAAEDAAHPFSNVIGIPNDLTKYQEAAKLVHSVLPKASFNLTCKSVEAELIKYLHNLNGYFQIIFFNLIYDAASTLGARWGTLDAFIKADPWISELYAKPVHKSGRGAGGPCFPKDFEAFLQFSRNNLSDPKYIKILESIRDKNLELLTNSGKDVEILNGVYNTDKDK